jgi:hypothetical protein
VQEAAKYMNMKNRRLAKGVLEATVYEHRQAKTESKECRRQRYM